MACLNADGTLTTSARNLIKAAQQPATVEEIAESTHIPLFMVRVKMRELAAATLVREVDGRYEQTEAGAAKVAGQ